MIKKSLSLVVVGCVSLSIAGCIGGTSSPKGAMKKKISQVTLANGSVVKYGYQTPPASWNCQTVVEKKYNWALQQFKGTVDISGGYQHLTQVAIADINSSRIRTNYFAMIIPTEIRLGAINVTALRKADVIYYQCQSLPAAN